MKIWTKTGLLKFLRALELDQLPKDKVIKLARHYIAKIKEDK